MFGKLLTHLIGNNNETDVMDSINAADRNKSFEDLYECEDGDWIVINIHESQNLSLPEVDPLEDLLIEHPSMSVYKLRFRDNQEDLEMKEKVEDSLRSAPAQRAVLWKMTAWAVVLGHDALRLHVQRARAHDEHKKLTRSALHRRNLAITRISAAQKHRVHFKQPPQHIYNY